MTDATSGSAPVTGAYQRQQLVEALLEGRGLPTSVDDTQLERLYESSLSRLREGELVKGRVVGISKNEVLIDIGAKSLGVVPRREFSSDPKVGEEVEVFVEKAEDREGRAVLSWRRAELHRVWERVQQLYRDQETVQVTIARRVKGGFVVDLMGMEAFLPGSQVDIRPVRDFDAWLNKTIEVRIVKLNQPGENVVVSRKVLLEDQIVEQRQRILSQLERGLVLEGTVKAITDFGVFIDLGGVDGLVHITDLSWGRVNHPSEIVSLDQLVKVVVLDFDEEKRRISLGIKQLTPHPWDTIGDKYQPGTVVRGKVVSITDYGAFVEIEKGIEGLIHISEMSWTQHIKHPSQVLSLGQMVEAMVLSIDKQERKLALGLKQLQPDPWQELVKKYPVGSRHKGVVRNITNFGVFVELEPGVEGLVHVSDLSWTKKVRHPGELVRRGQELEVVVLGVDPEHRRIALGHKQLQPDPWEYFAERYKVGAEAEGRILRILERGVMVELPDGVDGYVPASQLSFAPVASIPEYFHVGDLLPLKVVELDRENRKVVLSVVEYLRDKDRSVIDAYNAQHPVPGAERYAFVESVASPTGVEPSEPAREGVISKPAPGRQRRKAPLPRRKTAGEARGEQPAAATGPEAEAGSPAEPIPFHGTTDRSSEAGHRSGE
ncbi:MAG: 30S ribosomal protein S1 [Candidatus Kapabacteria bacterium]|nr:30S ribosomal protein S1 [Candidatus Kapabacteria bacterium]MCS7169411.1 30S ribosomal protein S1 [Candidatus Kapabacteria bacterium]MDW7997620.1 30S ribosomal protein S1 [Bacteroidota bacterium]MDW8224402.1 30S ribosomal protein S1 [Bacteroidota bacterium]